jgi:glycerol-3-phosphate acyltransferase PlsX
MGGDNAPASIIEGVSLAAKKNDEVFFLLFGDENQIYPLAQQYKLPANRFKVHHTTAIIKADEKPSAAVRSGRESSMFKAVMSVRNGYSKAVVSAGNTGALMAISKICLGTLLGIDRPAIAAVLPSLNGPSVVLDLGANAECNSQNLVEFSIMGDVLYRILFKKENPSIGLLNIGSEDTKGREEIREAAAVLKEYERKLNFKGFIEGNDIGLGSTDVVVADGFSGNVALKAIEGTAKFITTTLKQEVKKSLLAQIGFLLASGSLRNLKKKMDPRIYNGALFLGLNGISVKSHGSADAFGFSHAIEAAVKMARNDICEKIKEELSEVMDVPEALPNDMSI